MASLSFLLTLLQNGGSNLGNIDGCVSRSEKVSIFLSAYLAKHEGKSNWYFMAFSFGPAVFAWIHRLRKRSSIRRKVHFHAIIIASTLLLDLLEETLIVEMASCLVSVGRLLSFVLVGLQASSLASYPAQYKHKDSFYELVVLWFMALHHVRRQEITVVIIFAVWTCYIVGFVIFVVIIFRGDEPIEDNLDKVKFFGPNILKTTLCLAPLILLLLLSTGTNSIVYRDLIGQFSIRMALNLSDGVEMLDVIIEEN
ncbi:hypothetical protein pdam_00011534 [Pocillopora damicornis]|uniref:Uncharacterized protein n=1 Tax=Pocillopora damicornis TaxID=46731 RepID=A0A3M6UMX3_POCDA|nr:hypothetical protein pdam_00011534 [Pocillopora damicornis]